MHNRGQTYDEVVNMNEAHHKPQGSASYNPDKFVTNKSTFQNVQGRFILPKVKQHAYHSHNSSNNHLQRKALRKITSSMDLDIKRKWLHRIVHQAWQTARHKDQPLQHLHIHHKLEDHHRLPQLTIRTLRDVKHVIINI